MTEADLIGALAQDGFTKRAAEFAISGLPCTETWRVIWTTKETQITNIIGQYNLACL